MCICIYLKYIHNIKYTQITPLSYFCGPQSIFKYSSIEVQKFRHISCSKLPNRTELEICITIKREVKESPSTVTGHRCVLNLNYCQKENYHQQLKITITSAAIITSGKAEVFPLPNSKLVSEHH